MPLLVFCSCCARLGSHHRRSRTRLAQVRPRATSPRGPEAAHTAAAMGPSLPAAMLFRSTASTWRMVARINSALGLLPPRSSSPALAPSKASWRGGTVWRVVVSGAARWAGVRVNLFRVFGRGSPFPPPSGVPTTPSYYVRAAYTPAQRQYFANPLPIPCLPSPKTNRLPSGFLITATGGSDHLAAVDSSTTKTKSCSGKVSLTHSDGVRRGVEAGRGGERREACH